MNGTFLMLTSFQNPFLLYQVLLLLCKDSGRVQRISYFREVMK